jgi:hypothetical protein
LLSQADKVDEVVEGEKAQTPNLKVSISASFPQSEIFGVKLINGHATQARLSIDNQEPQPITVSIVGGSLIKDAGDQTHILRNLTGQRYGLEIPAGEEQTLTYSFATEMHPQDVRLQLVAVLQDKKNNLFTLSAYNETVTIVEAPTSIFDPQMYARDVSFGNPVLTTHLVFSCTSFFLVLLVEPSTSSTTPGSRLSSPSRSAAARVVSAPRSPPAAPRRSIPQSRLLLWVRMARLSLLAPGPTMRAGFQHSICSAQKPSASALAGLELPRPRSRAKSRYKLSYIV